MKKNLTSLAVITLGVTVISSFAVISPQVSRNNVAAVAEALAAAPSEFIATPVLGTQVNLSWKDIGGVSYIIERSTSGAKTGFIQIGTVPAGVSTYSDTTVSPSTYVNTTTIKPSVYWYRVRAAVEGAPYSKTDRAQTPFAGGNVYYIAPTGSDAAGCTSAAPCATFQKAYSVMAGGDTLIVKDGTYNRVKVMNRENGVDVLPPGGSATRYTRVVAEHDGNVIIDGQGSVGPFQMNGWPSTKRGYIEFRGMVVRRQGLGAVSYGMNYMKFIRMGFEDGPGDNSAVFAFSGRDTSAADKNYSPRLTNYVLCEECYVWGSARYKFSSYDSTHVIFRRSVARQDWYSGTEPMAVFQMYSTDYGQCQNCISVDGDQSSTWRAAEYGASFSMACTDAPASYITYAGSIAYNVDLPFIVTCKANYSPGVFHTNMVGWKVREGGIMRNPSTMSAITLGNAYGPERASNYPDLGFLYDSGGDQQPFGSAARPAPTFTNGILYKINYQNTGTAISGFGSVTNTFFNSNANNGQSSGTGNVVDSNDPQLKYILRTTDAGNASARGKGANITKQLGWPGTLWGESVVGDNGSVIGTWNTETSEDLWPFPFEEIMAKHMKTYSYSSISGNRGFAALYPASQTPLTDYLWKALGNPVPPEYQSGTATPPQPTFTITASAGTGGTITPAASVTVAQGGSQSYLITPASGYQVANVLVNGVSVGPVNAYLFSNVTSNQTISATFSQTAPASYTLSTSATNGTITKTPNQTSYTSGATVTLTATPNSGYQFSSWSGSVTGTQNPTSVTMNANKSVTATFTAITPVPPTAYTITASAGTGGSISPVGAVSVSAGTSRSFAITPASGYQIATVTVDGVSVGAVSTYTFSNVQSAHTISATFSQVPVTGIFKAGDRVQVKERANVRTSPNTSASRLGRQSAGALGTIVGGPATGNGYTWWNVNFDSGVDGWIVETYLALYTAPTPTYTITASAGSGGSISPTGAISLKAGASQTFTIMAFSGYQISNVVVDGTSLGPISTHTISSISGNHTISATFSQVPTTSYTLTSNASGGTITRSPNQTSYAPGTVVTLTAVPNAGYKFTAWSRDGFTWTENPTTITLDRNKTITALFSALPQSTTTVQTYSLWNTSVVPQVKTDPDADPVELGVKFRADVNGTISKIRFYKGSSLNGGVHTGHIWTKSGQLLGTATFTNETSSGWQTATFATPVPISANTTYIASYFAPMGKYAGDTNYFMNSIDVPPLRALKDGIDGPNGVYKYGPASAFPTDTYMSTNYWVDVVFTPANATTATLTSEVTTKLEVTGRSWLANAIDGWNALFGK